MIAAHNGNNPNISELALPPHKTPTSHFHHIQGQLP
jgi:hypothetical protein